MSPSQLSARQSSPPSQRRSDTALVALFLLTLWLPLAASLISTDAEVSQTEQRFLSTLPGLEANVGSLASFPSRMDAYYDDHLGFRTLLIRGQALLDIGIFGVSPTPKLVVGKQGWFFFGDKNAIAQYRGVAPLSDDQLRAWARTLEERRDWLAERGIAFLLVLVPDKHLVYPEFMPDSLPRASHVHPLDQLSRYLAQHADIAFVDLRDAMEHAKREARVYHRTDSHWNDLGAWHAYRAIHAALRRLVPALAGVEAVAVRQGSHDEPGMGLASIVGLAGIYHEEVIEAEPVGARSSIKPEHRADYAERVRTLVPIAHGVDDESLPRAVMFRDSFANALIPYVSEDFQRILYVWNRDVDPRVVMIERPDVVIQEIVGRFLGRRPKGIEELLDGTRREAR